MCAISPGLTGQPNPVQSVALQEDLQPAVPVDYKRFALIGGKFIVSGDKSLT